MKVKILSAIVCIVLLATPLFAATVDISTATGSKEYFNSQTVLNAATETGDGNTIRLPSPMSQFTWHTVVAGGTLTALSVTLQGSLDGTSWDTLDTNTGTTSAMRHVVYKPVLYIKVNLGTITTNTGTPAITVKVIGQK